MAITKPTAGATGWNTATDAVIDIINATTLAPTAVKTAAYTAAVGDFVPVDTTGGAITVTLPAAPVDGATVGVRRVIGSSTVTVARGGSDTFNTSSTSYSMNVTDMAVFQYKASTAIWYVISTSFALAKLDPRYILIAATTQASSYTLAAADLYTAVEFTSATAVNCTVPPNSSVAFDVGTMIEVCQYGAGQVTLVAGSGVTLRTPATLTTRAQYSTVTLRYRGSDVWVVGGDLT